MSTQEYDELEKLFNGSWKIVREENMDAFNAAAEVPAKMADFMKTETMYTIHRDGSSFKEKSTFSSGMELGSTMKLNEDNWWKDNETNPTIHFKTTVTLKDGVLTQDVEPQLANTGKRHYVKFTTKGNEMVAELGLFDGSGVVGKRFYEKC